MSVATSLKSLHEFPDDPPKFWPEFLAFACRQASAQRCILFTKNAVTWKQQYQYAIDQRRFNFSDEINSSLNDVAEKCLQQGQIHALIKESQLTILGILLQDQEQPSVLIFLIHNAPSIAPDHILARLQLLTDTPAIYQRNRAFKDTQQDLTCFSDVLDLLLLLNGEDRFMAATMTLANELAARYHCTRVSLGWQVDGYVKVQTISHMERFEPKMDVVTALEAAMEETFDQDEEILLPPSTSSNAVTRDHATYAQMQQVNYLASLPLRSAQQPIAVLCCERNDKPFSADEIRGLRIICDQVVSRLVTLKESDCWIGALLATKFRKQAAGIFGFEHTLIKLSTLVMFLLLLCSFVIDLPYRVEAPFMLRSEDVQQVSTPFEGYIEAVHVKIGEQVEKGQPLLSLDTRDLHLEESAALANQVRYLREAEKARAFGSLIDMKIAQAQADQAKAQLDLIRYRLQQSELRSSMAGIVVEGDLGELRGAPVSKGDILFKVARHEKLYIEFKVNERDIHEVAAGQVGEIAFVSQPGIKYPISVEQIDPVALADDTGNSFVARANSKQQADRWWRPGMSGIAKIEVGDRSIIWILTHRTFDFFQMLIWW